MEFNTGSCLEWQRFFKQFEAHMCPCCVRLKRGHCSHMARNRNVGREHRVTGAAHEHREAIKDLLWAQVEGGTASGLGFGELELARMHGVTRADGEPV